MKVVNDVGKEGGGEKEDTRERGGVEWEVFVCGVGKRCMCRMEFEVCVFFLPLQRRVYRMNDNNDEKMEPGGRVSLVNPFAHDLHPTIQPTLPDHQCSIYISNSLYLFYTP